MAAEPVEKWRIETNDRYNKIVTSVISLATGSLVLPALFLREFLGIPKEKALTPFLNYGVYLAWICLGLSILSGLIFSWLSVKWVKLAWGKKILVSERFLERVLDVSFLAMWLLFPVGVVLFSVGLWLANFAPAQSTAASRVDITVAEVPSLIGLKSENLSVFGLHLGMSRPDAERLLRDSGKFMGIQDEYNSTRIHVYEKLPNGAKGKAVLYLIWETNESGLQMITVFQDSRAYLTPSFRRLLTFEAVDNASEFKRRFIGYPHRSKITLDIPTDNIKHTTYFYDEIGLRITHQHHGKDEAVVFTIVKGSS
jgi:hypothetical protein